MSNRVKPLSPSRWCQVIKGQLCSSSAPSVHACVLAVSGVCAPDVLTTPCVCVCALLTDGLNAENVHYQLPLPPPHSPSLYVSDDEKYLK